MKTGSTFVASMFLAGCLIVTCADLLYGQGWWQPVMGDGGQVTGLVTSNGITSVEYTYFLMGCDQVSTLGPLIRNGNHFSYDFSILHEYGVPCPLYVLEEQLDVLLGALAPGTYDLTTTAWSVPIATNTFTIQPMLRPIGFDTNGYFQMRMSDGVTNVSYILQCSSNLVDWVSISTNSLATNLVGVRLTDKSSGILLGCRFYRLQCE